VEAIEDEIRLQREKANADATFYRREKEAQANRALLTPEYLQLMSITSYANNAKVYFGDKIPSMSMLFDSNTANANTATAGANTDGANTAGATGGGGASGGGGSSAGVGGAMSAAAAAAKLFTHANTNTNSMDSVLLLC
jgi:uncharacterized membrane protein YgcG